MTWSPTPHPPPLTAGEVHLWRIPLERDEEGLARDRPLLSDLERRRADRLRFPVHRRRFVAAHGALRRLLSRYLDRDPGSIAFSYGERGKPYLADPPDGIDLRFNLSDSEDLALCAVALGREVGIDLERMRRDMAFLRLAERWFAPSEIVALRETPEQLIPAAFFACWTRKEAWVKALGGSILGATRRFAVSVDPAAERVGLTVPGDPDAAERWSIVTLDVDPRYAGALAIEGEPERRRYRWSE
ncbi:MAG: 4'-phosphopantetheinyl transferase superfamily protein [Gemmatimonadota bacterium]|nr:4'-phosphopantetheinyl transferase superfamily protein [Gemmatimonadota bacterium]